MTYIGEKSRKMYARVMDGATCVECAREFGVTPGTVNQNVRTVFKSKHRGAWDRLARKEKIMRQDGSHFYTERRKPYLWELVLYEHDGIICKPGFMLSEGAYRGGGIDAIRFYINWKYNKEAA